jgi:hypothetical protein
MYMAMGVVFCLVNLGDEFGGDMLLLVDSLFEGVSLPCFLFW